MSRFDDLCEQYFRNGSDLGFPPGLELRPPTHPIPPVEPPRPRSVYIIGSLRNPNVPQIAAELRVHGHDVFDDWYAAGPRADDHWRDYEKAKGNDQVQALDGYAAKHVFEFDQHHLRRCEIAVLLYPAGKSGHLELGYCAGLGKECHIVLDNDPERYDVMLQFGKVHRSSEEFLMWAANNW